MKIWMGAITRGPADILIKNADVFDNGVFTVDSRTDKEEKRNLEKVGYVIERDFQQAHDWRANDWLHAGYIKPGDWVCILDTTDEIAESFKAKLRDDVEAWDRQGIRTVYLDRPLFFKFTGHQYFDGSPHWGVRGLMGNVLELEKTPGYVKSNYLINNRDTNVSGIEHPIKYFVEYKRSNHTQLLYAQFGQEIYNKHENARIWFQGYVEHVLKMECTVQNVVDYLKEALILKNLSTELVDYIDAEIALQDLVRYYILKQDFLGEIAKNRFNWSFKKYYNEGIMSQKINDGFIGLFNRYRMAQGRGME